MSFVVKKLQPAEENTLEAAIWYEGRQVGLGDDFLGEIDPYGHNDGKNLGLLTTPKLV